MSTDTLVQHLTDTLRCGHSLFGKPTDLAGTAALTSSTNLARGENHVRTGVHHISGLSGALPTAYTQFTYRAAPHLHAAAHTDTQLGAALREAGLGRIHADCGHENPADGRYVSAAVRCDGCGVTYEVDDSTTMLMMRQAGAV